MKQKRKEIVNCLALLVKLDFLNLNEQVQPNYIVYCIVSSRNSCVPHIAIDHDDIDVP